MPCLAWYGVWPGRAGLLCLKSCCLACAFLLLPAELACASSIPHCSTISPFSESTLRDRGPFPACHSLLNCPPLVRIGLSMAWACESSLIRHTGVSALHRNCEGDTQLKGLEGQHPEELRCGRRQKVESEAAAAAAGELVHDCSLHPRVLRGRGVRASQTRR